MSTAANVVVLLLALIHVYILVLEMFLWETPRGRKAFGLSPEFAAASKVLGANQGLYNRFPPIGANRGQIPLNFWTVRQMPERDVAQEMVNLWQPD